MFGVSTSPSRMFVFTILMLGRLNRVEVKLFLTIVGIISIMMGLVISVGCGAALGYTFNPMNAMLPFIFLGELNLKDEDKNVLKGSNYFYRC